MRYISTRGSAPEIGFCDVLLAGLARDGGLYVPQTWPKLDAPKDTTLKSAVSGEVSTSYAHRAASIMAPFIGDEIDSKVFQQLCVDAYSTFRHPDVAPLIEIAPD